MQYKFLIVTLHKREEGLYAIKVWAVRYIEDLLHFPHPTEIEDFFGLVNLEVVHEHGELGSSKAVREEVDEADELLSAD